MKIKKKKNLERDKKNIREVKKIEWKKWCKKDGINYLKEIDKRKKIKRLKKDSKERMIEIMIIL